MRYPLALLASLGLGACATAGSDSNGQTDIDAPSNPGVVDAPAGSIDAPVVDAPMVAIDAAAVDAPVTPIDAPVTPIDAAPPTDAPTTGQVDTCNGPLDITAMASAGTGVTLTGNTTGYGNNIDPGILCTTYTTAGPDAIYALSVTAGKVVTATVTPTTSWDPALMLVTPCATAAGCLAGDDNGLSGVAENVSYTATSTQTIYLVVDGWSSTTVGPYSLQVRIQ